MTLDDRIEHPTEEELAPIKKALKERLPEAGLPYLEDTTLDILSRDFYNLTPHSPISFAKIIVKAYCLGYDKGMRHK